LYCLAPEKPLRLVYGTFYLAIGDAFYEAVNIDEFLKSGIHQVLGVKF